jgi:predicted dehydrogenase
MQRFRIGIVGTGFGAIAHLPALQKHSRFDVVALASPKSAARVAKERGVPHAFTSCAEMLDGVELDAVTVASPPFAHHDDVLAALAARKHVLCEKPFALNVAQAQAMCDAAAAAGTASGIVHEFRFIPELQALHELARNGHLGEIRDIEVTLLRSSLRREELRTRSWWFEKKCGGGFAGAILSHLIDQADWLAGRAPQRSSGLLRTANPQRHDEKGEFTTDVDDGAAALLLYEGGAFARVCADGTVPVESITVAVHGEQRTGVASGTSFDDLSLYAVSDTGTDELTCTPPVYAKRADLGANVPMLMELYDQFAHAIDGEANVLPTFEDGLTTQRVLAAVGYGV